jgi:hypothetical protein
MNSHNRSNHDPFDVLISRCLKNWLRQQDPPEDAKEKLLELASITMQEVTPRVGLWEAFLLRVQFWYQSLIGLLVEHNSPVFDANGDFIKSDSPYYSDVAGQMVFQSFHSRLELMRLIS